MEIYDTIVLLIVLAGAFFGWRKGLATQVASIVSIVASYMVAVNFRATLAEKIDAAPPWNTFAAMLLLYLGTSLIIWLAFRQVRSTIEAMKLREFDHQMGALFGAAKGFILACVVTLFAVTLLHENQRQTIMHSQSGYLIARFLNNTAPFMPQEVRNFLGPYLDRLELDRLERRLESYPGGLQADPGYPVPNSTYPSGNYAQPGYPQLPYPSPATYPPPSTYPVPSTLPGNPATAAQPSPIYIPPGATR